MSTHRREFLRSSLAASTLVSLGSRTVPAFLGQSALAAGGPGAPGGARALVVVQLLGGNDGLNTVIPFGHDGYNRHRRVLRVATPSIQKLDKEIGLHPALGALTKLVEDGRLAIVQGVGYPNPDRSHFRSMEIWESARLDPKALETGWLGRTADAFPARAGDDLPAIHLGTRALPLALKARKTEVPSIAGLEQYRLQFAGNDADRRATRDAMDRLVRAERPEESADPLLGFVRRSALTAYESSRRLEQVRRGGSGKVAYPNFGLAQRLEQVAQILKAGFGTRIFYTSLDGFDTHANQAGTHTVLLTELADSLAAFHKDLAEAGEADRVAVLVFSEFGRRVAENASAGTDHGAAAPVFVMGPLAKSGLVGAHPSLETLDDGDLIHHTDFRRVYSALLEQWLGVASAPILGEGFPAPPLFRS